MATDLEIVQQRAFITALLGTEQARFELAVSRLLEGLSVGGAAPVSIFDITNAVYGAAVTNTAAQNTTAINAAIAACGAAGGGLVLVPRGTFQFNALATITSRHVWIVGQGPASELRFVPTANSQIAISFDGTGGAGRNRVMDLTLNSIDHTFTGKVGIKINFVDEFKLDNVVIGTSGAYWTDNAHSSVAVQVHNGHNFTKIDRLTAFASQPLHFSGALGADFAAVTRSYLVASGVSSGVNNTLPVVGIDADSGLGSAMFDDCSVIGGSAGFKWPSDGTLGNVGQILFRNIRAEQPGAQTNWTWDIQAGSPSSVYSLLFQNCTYSTDNGLRLRRAKTVVIENMFASTGGAGTAIDVDSVSNDILATNFNATPNFTMSGQKLVIDAGTTLRLWKNTADPHPSLLATLLSLRDTSAAFDVVLKATSSSALTADRNLIFDVVNAARTLKIQGNPTLDDWFDQSVKTTVDVVHRSAKYTGALAGNHTSALVTEQANSAISQIIAWGPDSTTRGRLQLINIESDGGNQFNGIEITADGNIQFGKALVALGGGAAPTLGTIGGAGPTVAAQNGWAQFKDSGGNLYWVPVWK